MVDAIVRNDLVAELETRTGLSSPDAGRVADAFLKIVKEKLLEGNEVTFEDFASLKIVEKKAQIVKDPETGHQFISPAENVVEFTPIESFQKEIESAKLSSIILAMPSDDQFTGVIEFHFSQVGWRVHVVSDPKTCLDMLATSAYLVIVDDALEGSEELIRDIKATRETSLIPLIALYPEEKDPDTSSDFVVLADEHLVEPFEVYTLLLLAEGELARSSEEEVIFEQQVSFQFGSTEENVGKACELAQRLFKTSGLEGDGLTALTAAFREACGNAMAHGNRSDPKKLVKVLYLLDLEKITIVVQDVGEGFQHKDYLVQVKDEDDAVGAARKRHEEGRVGGLGIMLMLKCADKLEYNDTGNMLTLTKYLSKTGD